MYKRNKTLEAEIEALNKSLADQELRNKELVQLQQQQQQLQQSASNSEVTIATAAVLTRKVVQNATIPCQTTPLEMSNNSTKKLNEPVEMCKECSMVFPTGLDLKKHIDLAHQVHRVLFGTDPHTHSKSLKSRHLKSEFQTFFANQERIFIKHLG